MFDINRIIGVFKLDTKTFAAIESDQAATTQAMIIVAIVAVLNGLGSGISTAFLGGHGFFGRFISTLLWGFVGWLLLAVVTYYVGTKFFGGKADLAEMMRVIGYAYAPLVLGIIPCVGTIIGGIWFLVACFFAIREGLDLDNTKTLITVLIGFAVYIIGMIVLYRIF
jgi:hypothetical protein